MPKPRIDFIEYWYIQIKKLKKEIKEINSGKIEFLSEEFKQLELKRRENSIEYYNHMIQGFSDYRQNLTGKEKDKCL